MIKLDTLYKRTSTGKIQTWFAEIEGNAYRTTAGYTDGKKTTTEWTYAEGKNIGRANETTPEEQAHAQVQSMYNDRLKKKYHKSIEEIDEQRYFPPMLAVKWADRKDKIDCEYVYIQPKLDGIRCIINKDGMWTRNGKPIPSSPHIWEALKHIFVANPNLTFDGELYNHDYHDDFDKLSSLIRKTKPKPADILEARESVQYWIYDMYDANNPDMIFSERIHRAQVMHQDDMRWDYIHFTLARRIRIDEVDDVAMEYIGMNFEGAMVRLDKKYELKRSKYLLKWKETEDSEYKIIDITEGEGNRSGIASRVILELPNGETFTAMPNGTFDYCKKLLENREKLIGQHGTVVYQNLTPGGVPRFPKFKVVRDYE